MDCDWTETGGNSQGPQTKQVPTPSVNALHNAYPTLSPGKHQPDKQRAWLPADSSPAVHAHHHAFYPKSLFHRFLSQHRSNPKTALDQWPHRERSGTQVRASTQKRPSLASKIVPTSSQVSVLGCYYAASRFHGQQKRTVHGQDPAPVWSAILASYFLFETYNNVGGIDKSACLESLNFIRHYCFSPSWH